MHAAAVVKMNPFPCSDGVGRLADRESVFYDALAVCQGAQSYLVTCRNCLCGRHFNRFTVAANDYGGSCLCVAQKGSDVVVGVDAEGICSRCCHRIP